MDLIAYLSGKREEMIDKWIKSTLDRYPADTMKVLRKNNDQFANPLKYNITTSLNNIYNQLIGDFNLDEIRKYLDEFIKIMYI